MGFTGQTDGNGRKWNSSGLSGKPLQYITSLILIVLSDEDHGIPKVFQCFWEPSSCTAPISLPPSLSMKLEKNNPRKILAVFICRDTSPSPAVLDFQYNLLRRCKVSSSYRGLKEDNFTFPKCPFLPVSSVMSLRLLLTLGTWAQTVLETLGTSCPGLSPSS